MRAMSRVITFSRTFPAYHPRKGEPTYFVEKIWNAIESNSFAISYEKICVWNPELNPDILWPFWKSIQLGYSSMEQKHHTIRSGNRWKVGDKFSPRVWSGKPYSSKQIIIAPDIEIKKVWEFEISGSEIRIDDNIYDGMNMDILEKLAKNDGLSWTDLLCWFEYPKPFTGQIICWSDSVNY